MATPSPKASKLAQHDVSAGDRRITMFGFGTRSAARTLTPTQVRQMGDTITLVDVREDGEWASGHIAGAIHIPLGSLRDELDRIPSGKPVVFYCHAGGRSSQAITIAMAAGQAHDTHMGGGISAWRAQGFPSAS
ncbi:rhodanese-like domain-containing protein [Mesorhizobium sp. M7A.F.Ca.US.002.01.1.1]|nr:rhodanese-like domain-containing protein [Mesorhizobium sp. M7A.F.Ca.US.002.01.1.1]